ncbi:MAG: cystathionine beta-synthase [Dehalococcoidia bacterium]
MKYAETILDTIGNTPLVKLNKIARDVKPLVLAKLEYFNPGGSVKDRIGIRMIEAAEKDGRLKPGGTIIENTSGNTGMGLALAAAVKGYRCIFTMPDKMSQAKIDLLRAFGAEVVVTPTAVEPDDPRSYYSVARRLSQEIPNSFYPNQYDNQVNPQSHYETTGPELWEQTDGRITHFVIGLGTGGTATGVGRYLKERNPEVKMIGADPVGSLYYEKFKEGRVGRAHTYLVEGIGEDFFPTTMDLSILDDVIQVNDRQSFAAARRLTRLEGIFAGGSAGTAVHAALEVAAGAGEDAVIVVLIPDWGEHYLSKVYNDEWMRSNQMLEVSSQAALAVLTSIKTRSKALISVSPSSLVFEAITMMKQHDVSQLPVFEDGESVGSVREDQIVELFLQHADTKNMSVHEVMGAPFPVVPAETDIEDVSKLLTRETPAVLIKTPDGLDILTRFDLITYMTTARR